MWPDRVSNPGPLALESDALPTALRGPARHTSRKDFAQAVHTCKLILFSLFIPAILYTLSLTAALAYLIL